MENNYQAFLLRLQRAESNGRWRSTLQNIQTGEIHHFATEREMVAHLLESLADAGEIIPRSMNGEDSHKRV